MPGAFAGADFMINDDNFTPLSAADYEFSSNQNWVTVDSSGKVSFVSMPQGTMQAQIRATPKDVARDRADAETLMIDLRKWFAFTRAHVPGCGADIMEQGSFCATSGGGAGSVLATGKDVAGRSLPSQLFSRGSLTISGNTAHIPLTLTPVSRAPGTLVGEWGNNLDA